MFEKLKEWDFWKKVCAGLVVAALLAIPQIIDPQETYRKILYKFLRDYLTLIIIAVLLYVAYRLHKTKKPLEENITKLTENLDNANKQVTSLEEQLSNAEKQVTQLKNENQLLVEEVRQQKQNQSDALRNSSMHIDTKLIDASHARLDLLTQQLIKQEQLYSQCTSAFQLSDIGSSISRLQANIAQEKKDLAALLSAIGKK